MFQYGQREVDARLLLFVSGGLLQCVQVSLGTRHVALLGLAARNTQLGRNAEGVMRLGLVGRIGGERLGRLGVLLETLKREGASEHGDVAERVVLGRVLDQGLVHVQRILEVVCVVMAFRQTQLQRRADIGRAVFGHRSGQLVRRVGARKRLARGGIAAAHVSAHAVETGYAQGDDEKHHQRGLSLLDPPVPEGNELWCRLHECGKGRIDVILDVSFFLFCHFCHLVRCTFSGT